ncbi:potassium channel family protein [Haloarchaeobius sp. HRN-SO-5]|uniref:potassium channel family protein n=1 Tax=Haloarchaeobius sp. HRN-SO-5 TaxID=3446118 RepID=UPI003EB9DE28
MSQPDRDPDLRVVIAGGGAVGLRSTRLLANRGHKVVLIERDPERGKFLSEEYVATVIEGDAARPSVLRQAQPERSDVVAALTGDENVNFAICLAAQRLADVRTVMRVAGPPDDLYDQFVDSIVFPEHYGARAATNEIVGEGVRSLEDVFGDVDVLEVEIAEGAPVAGKRLEDVRLPRGSLIIVDADGEHIGGPETVLEAGNRYLLAVEADVADEVMNLMRG